ncbi:MAG: lysophospholipid acyltransferase family protein [Hydrogenophaga sp.]|uniref:lysophospholipid acyltransferase family protein n=1 Tax=Hydrogenophaga sp. TaxID=1904254 RepID=UPI00276CFE55|nr:lysophospholipid acyltransferase family protein [Hydrogenophaga sp.]MDP2418669.1 lysophospholipid acyltransferase family protein [Hydrogenophaga sp.]MDZ4189833.1 lysophospholipid acyltransferase family protein [Hydrogenophaga sp.]
MNRWLASGRAVWRALRVLGHVLRGLWIIRTQVNRATPAQAQVLVRAWASRMVQIMGVTLVVRGTPPTQGPALQVANHVSWLDVVVMNAAQPSRFVSKSDVKHWPVLGTIITGAGTLYIERENRRDAMRVVHHMAERLQAHDVLTVFPEGTTGDGREMLPFHANLFQAAIAVHAPVVPVALRFIDSTSGQRSDAPVFIGDTTLVASIWTTLCAHRLQAVLVYGEPQTHNGRDRRTWAQDMRTEVARLLATVTPGD